MYIHKQLNLQPAAEPAAGDAEPPTAAMAGLHSI